jgi:DNA polymerase alpha subunit A
VTLLISVSAKRKREEDREKEEKVNNSINKYFTAKPAAVAVPKAKVSPAWWKHISGPDSRQHVVTADDTAFLDDLLGSVETSVSRKYTTAKPVKTESRRKTRVLSPPIELPRQDVKQRRPQAQQTVTALDTPPATQYEDDDAGLPSINNDDDMIMSDAVAPSSPVARAVERKAHVAVKIEEEDDDDMMEVSKAVGHAGALPTTVNKSGSRPIPKIVKHEALPTPESSSPPGPTPDVDASSWINVTSKLNVVHSPAAETVTIGKLDSKDAVEEDGSLRFFWFDYTEINGSLLLFGKVKNKKNNTYVSCFVKVDGVLRKLFFLPRDYKHRNGRATQDEVEMGDVYQEVDSLMTKMRVGMHKIKPSTRKYAFELPDIPKEADYLKLLYPYDKPALDIELKGETFSHVFGTNTSLFEQFVLWKNIMGPCWLRIEDADFTSVTNASWCKLEVQVRQAKTITALDDAANQEAPPLTIMSIALRTTMNVKDNKQEIIMASARVYQNISLTDTSPPEKLPCKTITVMRPVGDGYPAGFRSDLEKHVGTIRCQKTERELLSLFLAELERIDPDVLMGHRLEDLDYSILLSRMRELKTPGWHRIGRLRRNDWPKNFGKGGGSFYSERQLVAGRLLCDLANDMGKSLMTKCQSWSLAEMCELVLGQGNVRREIDNEQALKTWATTREGLMNYLKHCEADTYYIAAIALRVQMLPLTKQLTNLAGNSWARTLAGTRAERNEYILLHEFHKSKYICPDKIFSKGKQKVEEEPAEGEEGVDTKKKDKFKGGLVFEPEKGLYDRFVLVMDFNSLYPSIIQEYNICFTTVDRSGLVSKCSLQARSMLIMSNRTKMKTKCLTSQKTRTKASCLSSLRLLLIVEEKSRH